MNPSLIYAQSTITGVVTDTESGNLTTANRKGHPQQHLFAVSGLGKDVRGSINIHFFDQPSVSIENVSPQFASTVQTDRLGYSFGRFPKAPIGVWITILLFTVLTVGIIINWAYLILKPALILK